LFYFILPPSVSTWEARQPNNTSLLDTSGGGGGGDGGDGGIVSQDNRRGVDAPGPGVYGMFL
jgi:hypothetical protein